MDDEQDDRGDAPTPMAFLKLSEKDFVKEPAKPSLRVAETSSPAAKNALRATTPRPYRSCQVWLQRVLMPPTDVLEIYLLFGVLRGLAAHLWASVPRVRRDVPTAVTAWSPCVGRCVRRFVPVLSCLSSHKSRVHEAPTRDCLRLVPIPAPVPVLCLPPIFPASKMPSAVPPTIAVNEGDPLCGAL